MTEDVWTTETGSRIKAWFVMRKDLAMTTGKFGIQIGHGTDLIHMYGAKNPFYERWIDSTIGNRRKIALSIGGLEDLMKIKAQCEEFGMIAEVIADAGLTEFGKPTITGLVIFPHDDANIPKSLKRARSWKDEPVVVPS